MKRVKKLKLMKETLQQLGAGQLHRVGGGDQITDITCYCTLMGPTCYENACYATANAN